jgi:hypothetical protein
LRDFPGRVVYVGILFVVGFFLVLYSKPENWALNIAGAMALVTALVPMQAPDYCTNCGSNTFSFVHDTAGVVLFVCLAFVACACTNSLRHLPDPIRRWIRVGYYVIAILMIAAPAAAIVMTVFFGIYDKKIFFVEWFAVWMFGAYWLLKSIELGISKAERNALMPNEPLEENSLRNGAPQDCWIEIRCQGLARGQKQTFRSSIVMSALPPRANICSAK